MRKKINIGLAIIPAVLIFILIRFDLLYSLDSMLCDTVYKQMNGCGDDIKIICIDEETLAEYGPLNTWSREVSAKLIEKLYSNPEYAPDVIAFDIMYIGETESEADDKLVDAAKIPEHVVVASNMVYRGKNVYLEGGVPYYDLGNIDTEERPYAALDEVALSGYANAVIAKDGFVRTAQIRTDYNGETRYSFATQIYNEYAQVNGTESVAALPEDDVVHFFYSGKPGEFTHFSLKDVMEDRIPLQEFAGSVVMIGAYAPGLQDSYHNTAKRSEDMYGVEINANIARALMTGKTATRVPALTLAVIFAIIMLVYVIVARMMKMYPAIIVGVWILLATGITGRIMATHGYVISLVYVLITVLIIWAWIIIEKYVIEAVKRKQTLNSFRKYMAPQVIEKLAKDGEFHIVLGGEKRHVAVLFVDIRGFTSMSEVLKPEQMVQILNKYLTLTTSCIFEHGGMLDKFIGDATMAIFNAPNDQEDYVYEAIMAGLDMQKKGAILGTELEKEFGRTVSFGVGIHVGDAVVGNIGCDVRMDYTAIGDTVNTASRIEGKAQKSEVLISEDTYLMVSDRIDAEFKETMTLKGKQEPVNVYMVKGIKYEEEKG